MRISFKWTIGTIAGCLVLMPLTVQGLIFGKPIIAWPCLVLVVASALRRENNFSNGAGAITDRTLEKQAFLIIPEGVAEVIFATA